MSAHYYILNLTWRPLSNFTLSERIYICNKFLRILKSWENTPYKYKQCSKQQGVDCVRFFMAALYELMGKDIAPVLPQLPEDRTMHYTDGAIASIKQIKRLLPKPMSVEDKMIEPGDIIITGSVGYGPGHAILVGPEKNTLWQAGTTYVYKSGLSLPERSKIYRIYRILDRSSWLS